MAGVLDEVGAFHGSTDHASGIAICGESFGCACPDVSGVGVVLQFLGQVVFLRGLAFVPFVHFVDGDGQALALVVAGVAGLRGLVDLGLAHDFPDVVFACAVFIAAGGIVELLGDGEAVWDLDVAIAS